MISEEVQEKLVETIIDKLEELNTTILEEVGKTIKEIGTLNPSKARQIGQAIKYGASYDKIIKKLEEVTKLNRNQIDEIFKEVAKKNQEFAKVYYDYRGLDFIPYEQNKALKSQVEAMARLTKDTYNNLISTSAFMTIEKGKRVYTPIAEVYQKTIDKAVLSLTEGREAFYTTMRKTIKEMAQNGIRTIDYATGYSRRLDSSMRMNILDGMRMMSNQIQEDFGKEFDADGKEISVHLHPAVDHQEAHGLQFSNKEFIKLQNGEIAKSYNGKSVTLDHDHNGSYRPISTMNCYHYVFSIVLGVNKPQYSDEKLQEIKEKNEQGFEYEGKHYTMYEGSQYQRRIETKIRSLKDEHIGLVAIGDEESLKEAGIIQGKIRVLTSKYNDLAKTSGLPTKRERMTVSGYKRIRTK